MTVGVGPAAAVMVLECQPSTRRPCLFRRMTDDTFCKVSGVLLFSPANCRNVCCMLFNSRSICNKLAELHHIMYVDNLDMIFVTETWLHCGITDGLLDPNSSYRYML